MSRLSILLFALVTACGGKSTPPPTTPLPADKPAETEAKAPETAPPVVQTPPEPVGPVEVKIPAAPVSVKLVSAGKGKKAPLRYSAKAGDKQQVELAMDFSAKQTEGGQSQDQIVPTIVLVGNAETTTVDKDGNASYTLTVNTTDARDVAGSQLPAEKFRTVLASLAGLTISSTLGANGAGGEVTMRIEKPTELSPGALELIRLTLPSFPVLPKEPVGVGAKWQATTSAKLADKLDVTQITDYELVSQKGGTWTIKGKTKVTGVDQKMEGGDISTIKGQGTSEATLADGALYPSSKSLLETEFTATEAGKSMQFALKVGGAVTPAKK
jgi:hypothetical protein